jgi:hypothetical protein
MLEALARDRPTRALASLIHFWVRPPMTHGAPRFIKTKDAEASFLSALPSEVQEHTVAEAEVGVERTRARLKGIEDRAATYVQAATLTSTLLLANGA